jgi:hypothetical protein
VIATANLRKGSRRGKNQLLRKENTQLYKNHTAVLCWLLPALMFFNTDSRYQKIFLCQKERMLGENSNLVTVKKQ